ncbi:putative FBD-associated F-box protein At5g56700 [Arabidopsis lyrata subsp. lyrata]|uniref:putative FBD-associated F-box protein At5g56700 n=1 Tax=Arabidopsis lyrata subsp. lyrata TaxID=81972 RepID=UPI000A29D9D0|nr:putative FBD-associated F-box protein At5g56700 [Arabidopsis lyrata subsp. lyrata]|eukprot:XP_020890802.1 putative FBD-associated F-box protein At5g56700 [Arabidopsis lyrata subsp. lyrata]
MAKMSELSDDLLVMILSFLPTKVAVSTSVLSKRWEFLWMCLPKLEYDDINDINVSELSSCQRYRNFIDKNLALYRAPIIESLRLRFLHDVICPEDIKRWVGISVSRRVQELSIIYITTCNEPVLLPNSLYTCSSLVALNLSSRVILVEVPGMAYLPSLKTLQISEVTYSTEESLELLLSCCPVLEDLSIERYKNNNVKGLVIIVLSLQRLTLEISSECFSDEVVIVTPPLKYFKVTDQRDAFSYLIKGMRKLEEAVIDVEQNPEKLLISVTSVKRLILRPVYHAGIVFKQLEYLRLHICNDDWSKLLVQLLQDSPKLLILNIFAYTRYPWLGEWEPCSWNIEQSSVPECLLESLETFEFSGYTGRPEESDFFSFILKNARYLNSFLVLREKKIVFIDF